MSFWNTKSLLRKTGLKFILFAAGIVSSVIFFTAYRSDEMPDFQYSLKSDDEQFFLKNEENAYRYNTSLQQVKAGICSHHLLMAPYISGFFKKLSMFSGIERIKTFIIIGPNHFSRGRAVVAVTDQKWKTPFGFVSHNSSITGELVKNGFAEYDYNAFTFEHSMGALIPFVKQYFPEADIVPVIIRHGFSEADAYRMGKFLAENTDESVFILLSADFVHNKFSKEILPIDKRSAELITGYDKHMSSGKLPLLNMDCNRGLQVLMSYVYQKKFIPDILLNTNSALVVKKDVKATSYFFVFFGERMMQPLQTVREQ